MEIFTERMDKFERDDNKRWNDNDLNTVKRWDEHLREQEKRWEEARREADRRWDQLGSERTRESENRFRESRETESRIDKTADAVTTIQKEMQNRVARDDARFSAMEKQYDVLRQDVKQT